MQNEFKNKFQRHDHARNARRAAADKTISEREARREQQRQSWQGPNKRGVARGAAGTVLDAVTLEAKQAMVADREARKAAEAAPKVVTLSNPLTEREEFLLAREWASSNPNWYASDYNLAQFKAIIETFDLPHTAAGFQQCFDYGVEHNHFEEPPVRKRGNMTPRRAPIPFVPPAPKAEEAVRSGNRPVYIRQNVSTEENHRLREMPFDELQKQVRAGQNRGRDYR